MRLNGLLIALAFFTYTTAYAQPVLTAATSNPSANHSTAYHARNLPVGTAFNAGSSGPNVIWDFSPNVIREYDNAGGYTTCANEPDCLRFPNSTIRFIDSATPNKMYYSATGSQLSIVGIHVGNADYLYGNPQDILRYPFTYSTKFVDTFRGLTTNIFSASRDGLSTVHGDGYGTLITPAGTYQNVLRVHTVITYKDTFYSNATVSRVINETYEWYSPTIKDYIFRIEAKSLNGNPYPVVVSWRKQAGVGFENSLFAQPAFTISPTPAQITLTIKTTSTEKFNYQLCDLSGRVAANAAGTNGASMNVALLPRGIYVLKAFSKDGSRAVQKVVLE